MDDPANLTAQANKLREEAAEAERTAREKHEEVREQEGEAAYSLGREDTLGVVENEAEAHHARTEEKEAESKADDLNRQAQALEDQAAARSIELEREARQREEDAENMAANGGDPFATEAISREADELRRRANGV